MRELQIIQTNTIKDNRSLDVYFNEVSKIPLLTANEEIIITRQVADGNSAAVTRLINANLRFVISVAKQYQNSEISLNDLINEGNIGLIIAAKKFDPTKGFKFISYAVWWIRQAIITALNEQTRLIHLPCNQITVLNRYVRESARFEQGEGRKPSIREIAEVMGLEVENLVDILKNATDKVMLDRPLGGESNFTLLDLISANDHFPDADIIKESLKQEVDLAMSILEKREKDILVMYFGLNCFIPRRLEEIAEQFMLSVEHVRRLKDAALIKIRCSRVAPRLASYLA
ncbi:sigma-70 family RNA polymerase sigma factor [Mucilaginibacter sp.]|uniref:sigma-70 family RNA polymerase sigma factor n=1 Tax=Mucilaginibacter sp. TaxID=1882438 RepID=UPI0026339D54|nr:sigma-70 family RNA polymerase sigma factor [Mucilaginibacter sp.]MDB4922970.1 polymerase subunit sigma [Mucilaginibacter sp.]